MRSTTIVIAAGLVAGVLDISYAFAVWSVHGVAPTIVLHSIASGVAGPAAYDGGTPLAALGAGLHFAMAVAMAFGFVALRRRLGALAAHPVWSGLAYGLALFCIMNLVVLPLSRAAVGLPAGWLLAGALFAHTVLVGLPIALITQWVDPRRVAG